MLWFERRVVSRLTTTGDPERREEVAAFVEGALHSMPEHLRASVGAASVALGAWARVPGGERLSVRTLDTCPIPQIRQYVRLFRSLVLFAEQELPVTSGAVRSAR